MQLKFIFVINKKFFNKKFSFNIDFFIIKNFDSSLFKLINGKY